MDRPIKYFCIGHLPPLFEPAEPFVFVSPNPKQQLASLVIPDNSLGPALDGKILSEYTQLFGLAEHSMITEELPRMYVFQYRKFISLSPGYTQASNVPYAYASKPSEANALFPRHSDLSALGGLGLVGPICQVRSLVDQYVKHHFAEDMCAFCATLTRVDGFDPSRIARFINCPLLLPTPSLGLVDAEIFLDHMKILRSAWELFAADFFQKRTGYQRRVGGFLLERLHSFLMTELLEGGDYAATLGFQIIVSDNPMIVPTT
jgi:hypothetical protein